MDRASWAAALWCARALRQLRRTSPGDISHSDGHALVNVHISTRHLKSILPQFPKTLVHDLLCVIHIIPSPAIIPSLSSFYNSFRQYSVEERRHFQERGNLPVWGPISYLLDIREKGHKTAIILSVNRENPNGTAYCVHHWARRCFVWIAVQKVPFVRCFHMD